MEREEKGGKGRGRSINTLTLKGAAIRIEERVVTPPREIEDIKSKIGKDRMKRQNDRGEIGESKEDDCETERKGEKEKERRGRRRKKDEGGERKGRGGKEERVGTLLIGRSICRRRGGVMGRKFLVRENNIIRRRIIELVRSDVWR